MEAYRILKIVQGKLCVVEHKDCGPGLSVSTKHQYTTTIKPLAQSMKIYNDDECKLVFDYIVNVIKGKVNVIAKQAKEYLCGADGYSHSHPMNNNIEECINYIIAAVIDKPEAYKSQDLSVSLGYSGPILFFDLIPSDAKIGFPQEVTFQKPIFSFDPKLPSDMETEDQLEIVGGKLYRVVDKDIEGLGRPLAQGIVIFDDAECKQVFDYISRVLALTLNIVSHESKGWRYNARMYENIENCIDTIRKHIGTSNLALDYHNGIIYYNAVDSNGKFI